MVVSRYYFCSDFSGELAAAEAVRSRLGTSSGAQNGPKRSKKGRFEVVFGVPRSTFVMSRPRGIAFAQAIPRKSSRKFPAGWLRRRRHEPPREVDRRRAGETSCADSLLSC